MLDQSHRPRRRPDERAESNPDAGALKRALAQPRDESCAFCGANPFAPIAAAWSFFCDRQLQSLNARLSNTGVKRWAYAADRNAWFTWMQVSKMNLRIPSATRRRRVIVERLFAGRQRAYDRGNLIGGAKALIDAMVLAKLITGDAPHELEDHYQQRQASSSGVRIWIQEFA